MSRSELVTEIVEPKRKARGRRSWGLEEASVGGGQERQRGGRDGG